MNLSLHQSQKQKENSRLVNISAAQINAPDMYVFILTFSTHLSRVLSYISQFLYSGMFEISTGVGS